jgi:hypothetical protein
MKRLAKQAMFKAAGIVTLGAARKGFYAKKCIF